jgi:hypothetical protein
MPELGKVRIFLPPDGQRRRRRIREKVVNSRLFRYGQSLFSVTYKWKQACTESHIGQAAMLRIQRWADMRVVFSLAGRIEAQDIEELLRLLSLEEGGKDLVFDLKELTLVDREGVEFLARCESERKINLENCPAYVREWIEVARGGSNPQKGK